MNTITHWELLAMSIRHLVKGLGEKLSSNHGVIARILTEFHPEDLTIKSSHCSGYEKVQALAAIHSQTLAVKNTFK